VFAGFAGLQDEGLPIWAPDLFKPNTPGSLTHFYHTMSSGRFYIDGEVGPRRYLSSRRPADFLAPDASERGRFGDFVMEILDQVDGDIGQPPIFGPLVMRVIGVKDMSLCAAGQTAPG